MNIIHHYSKPIVMFSIFEGLGAGRVDGLGEAGRVGRLDLASAALSGEILHSVADTVVVKLSTFQ